jgi:hypothetical protein
MSINGIQRTALRAAADAERGGGVPSMSNSWGVKVPFTT